MVLLGTLRAGDPLTEPNDESFVLPVGTVTFLLTDVQGSVKAWEHDPTAMQETTKHLGALIADAVGAHNGVLVRAQGEGDSALAAFARASDAVASAVALQRSMRDTWNDEVLVRIGINTGEATFHHDGQYFGRSVNRCARIRDAGHGGQVLLSSATRDLVSERLPDGVTLVDLGAHQLRDLAMPEHLWQLSHADLAASFPPLRTLDVVPNNIPRQQTRFIGRVDDIERVTALLADARLVTLTGPGGVGKTRLSVQVAAEMLDSHPDGSWFIDLSKLEASTGVIRAIMTGMSLREQADRDDIDTLTAAIGQREMLIVLDNCEHVIEAAADVVNLLLQACGDLRVLATSRESLQLPSETTWVVPSLSIPAVVEETAVEAVSRSDAAALFIDRALKARPNFEVSESNASIIAEICRRLDGIPLAIELAASRCRVLSVEQIRDGLEDRFRLLTGRARTVMPRQQTLRASVDWSYDLLDASEQGLLNRLSVFVGSFTLDEAEQVCSDDEVDRLHVLDLLTALVDRSLVQSIATQPPARYRLLDTIRAYATEKLGDGIDAVRTRLVKVYVTLTGSAAQGWEEDADQSGWFDWLDEEMPNIEVALHWADATAMPELAKIVVHLRLHMFERFQLHFLRHWLDRAAVVETTDLRVKAMLAIASARVAGFIGSTQTDEESLAMFSKALLLAEESGDRILLAHVRVQCAMQTWLRAENITNVIADLARAVEDAQGAPEDPGSARAQAIDSVAMANVSMFDERCDEAESHLQRGLDWVDSRETPERAWFMVCLGRLREIQGRWADAIAHFDGVIQMESRMHTARSSWAAYFFRSLAFARLGRREEAVADMEACLRIHLRMGQSGTHIESIVAERAGDLPRAVELFEKTYVPRVARMGTAETHLILGARLMLTAGMYARARELYQDVLDHPVDGQPGICEVPLGFGLCALADGDLEGAVRQISDALDPYSKRPDPTLVADVFDGLGLCSSFAEDFERAARLFGAADSVRAWNTTVPPPWLLTVRERAIADARAALDGSAFERSLAEGASMSRDEAITFAGKGRGTRKRPSTGWASLTPVESQVVRHVREGLSNPQIAKKMFLSPRTVQTHVSHILAKLSLTSRVELATEAARRE